MEGQYHPKYHYCLACVDKRITWTFAICSDCEKIHGTSPHGWPEWLRFSWKDENRRRRRISKLNSDTIGITYGYLEEVEGFVHDGIPFMLSNRNNDRLLNNEIITEWVRSLPDISQAEVGMFILGHTQEDTAKVVGLTRAMVGIHLQNIWESF